MIVVDTSALLAILLREPEARQCLDALRGADIRAISAGTLQEYLIVAAARGVGAHAEQLLGQLDLDVHPVSEALARQAAEAYGRFGKGLHPARLNLADCFAYALAAERDSPLLFIGNDFDQTDIEAAR